MRIGVLGGGQLGKMLGLAGVPMGHEFVFFDDGENPCASAVGEVRSLSDLPGLRDLDVLTYEFENVFEAVDRAEASGVVVAPPRRAIEVSSDRLAEKDFFTTLAIPTPRYRPFVGEAELRAAIAELGYPCVAKTRRFGYDGKGQMVLRGEEHIAPCARMAEDAPMILEAFVPFSRELSIIGTRSAYGSMVFYPLCENNHQDGILRMTIAPAPNSQSLQADAERMLRLIADRLEYVGTLTLELFDLNGELLANEMAPRVHNSGHWTIEGAVTSQFENHIRAITGLPLGTTEPRGVCAMVNLVGQDVNVKDVLSIRGAHYHWYGKEIRANRKVGHITVLKDSEAELGRDIARVTAMVPPPIGV